MNSTGISDKIGDIEVSIFRQNNDPVGYVDFTLKLKNKQLCNLVRIFLISYHVNLDDTLEYGDSDDRTYEVSFNSEIDFYRDIFKPEVEEIIKKQCEQSYEKISE